MLFRSQVLCYFLKKNNATSTENEKSSSFRPFRIINSSIVSLSISIHAVQKQYRQKKKRQTRKSNYDFNEHVQKTLN